MSGSAGYRATTTPTERARFAVRSRLRATGRPHLLERFSEWWSARRAGEGNYCGNPGGDDGLVCLHHDDGMTAIYLATEIARHPDPERKEG